MGENRKKNWRSLWTKQLYLWHWVSSAICLVGMVLFAFTGITLNHAGQITADPKEQELTGSVPAAMMALVAPGSNADDSAQEAKDRPMPKELRRWIERNLSISLKHGKVEWDDYEIYLGLPKPGGDAWLTIDRSTGDIFYSQTDRGIIAYLNDLHKGRNTGSAWIWFLDLFSLACIVFCLTGFFLLWMHAKRRPSTWPVVVAGVILPLLILIVFVH